ncbi:MAG: hypothetical protein ACRECW_07240 [Phyllobacterium sp.]
MKLRTNILASLLVVSVLAGCQKATFEDLGPNRAELAQVSDKLVKTMKAKGMTKSSPIMVRIFKEENQLEIWKRKDNGRYDLLTSYEICKWSGKLGPKYVEGDRQAPEGFYTVRPAQMNPRSSYYLSFNLGFPNAYDRANGRTGQHLMVHGACSSAGCYSMTDEQVAEIYALGRDSFRGGQTDFQVQAFPFRMTAANMARYRNDPNYAFWKMLKEGYDHFEITKIPPKVDVCEQQYVFNRTTDPNSTISSTASCPAGAPPDSLRMAYQSYQTTYEAAFSAAAGKGKNAAPSPSIQGIKEAQLISAWSKARAAGVKVSREPPSLSSASAEQPNAPDIKPAPAAAPAPATRPSVTPISAPAPDAQQGAAALAPDAIAASQATMEEAVAPVVTPAAKPGSVETVSASAPAAADATTSETPVAEAAAPTKKPWWKIIGN